MTKDIRFARARIRFSLSLGVMISLLYYSVLRQQQIAFYEMALLVSLTLAALVFDHMKLGQLLSVFRSERLHRSHDQAIRVALVNVVKSSFLLKLLETKLLTLYYAFFAKFDDSAESTKNHVFSYVKTSDTYNVFLLVATSQLPFLPFIHPLVEYKKGPVVAWAITLVTLWSVIWYLAQVEAVKARPIEMSDRQLHYRFGLFWTADIPLNNIKTARELDVTENIDRKGLFRSPFGSARNVFLEFEEPVLFTGPYSIRRRKSKAAISLDNPSNFLSQLALRGVVVD